MFPPRVATEPLEGSGAKCSPWARTASVSRLFTTPACARIARFGKSISRIAFIRLVETTTPPAPGSAPPLRPVPAPRAVKGMPFATHHRTSRAVSSVLLGSATAVGRLRSTV